MPGSCALGALGPEAEQVLERHLAGRAACLNEERRLRETTSGSPAVSIAVSSTLSNPNAHILGPITQRGGVKRQRPPKRRGRPGLVVARECRPRSGP